MRLLGLDVGESRIGVALSDPLGKTAQPMETIQRAGAIERLGQIARETGAEGFVVGLPLLMNGTEGEQARRSRQFGDELAGQTGVEVHFVDERLTTKEAEAVLKGGRVKRGKKREASDRVAAALILRAYMDSLPEE